MWPSYVKTVRLLDALWHHSFCIENSLYELRPKIINQSAARFPSSYKRNLSLHQNPRDLSQNIPFLVEIVILGGVLLGR